MDRSTSRGGRHGPTPGSVADQAADADPAAVARALVLRQLTAGPRTRSQLAQALRRRDVPEDVAAEVLDRFTEVELIDDEEFARQWVSSRQAGRGLARRALAHELRHRGVADDLVKAAVAEIDPETELRAARELVRRRLPSTARDDPARRTRRLAGMLARKGYGPEIARRAIRDELDSAEADDLPGADPDDVVEISED